MFRPVLFFRIKKGMLWTASISIDVFCRRHRISTDPRLDSGALLFISWPLPGRFEMIGHSDKNVDGLRTRFRFPINRAADVLADPEMHLSQTKGKAKQTCPSKYQYDNCPE